MKIRLKWPFDTATTLSIIAIVLTLIQLVLSTPVLTEFYLTPDLVITGGGEKPDAKVLMGVFEVENRGRASAKNVQIGFMMEEHQRLSIVPNINAKIVQQDEPIFFTKNVRIEIPKLTPKEKVRVMIYPGSGLEQLRSDLAKFFMEAGLKEFPAVSFIKSDEGDGKNLTANGNIKSFNSHKNSTVTAPKPPVP